MKFAKLGAKSMISGVRVFFVLKSVKMCNTKAKQRFIPFTHSLSLCLYETKAKQQFILFTHSLSLCLYETIVPMHFKVHRFESRCLLKLNFKMQLKTCCCSRCCCFCWNHIQAQQTNTTIAGKTSHET